MKNKCQIDISMYKHDSMDAQRWKLPPFDAVFLTTPNSKDENNRHTAGL